jgi:hypothetical protein
MGKHTASEWGKERKTLQLSGGVLDMMSQFAAEQEGAEGDEGDDDDNSSGSSGGGGGGGGHNDGDEDSPVVPRHLPPTRSRSDGYAPSTAAESDATRAKHTTAAAGMYGSSSPWSPRITIQSTHRSVVSQTMYHALSLQFC